MLEEYKEFEQFLSPDYWDGHSIGYCQDARRLPELPLYLGRFNHSQALLEERVAQMERAVPLVTIRNGQVFDPAKYNPGTLLLFSNEILTGSIRKMPDGLDLETLTGIEVPDRPMDTSPNFNPAETSGHGITDGNLTYQTDSFWGVVGLNVFGKHQLHSVATGLVGKMGGGVVKISKPDSFGVIIMPLTVGETRHFKRGPNEQLHRVNIIDVVAHGVTQRKRERLRGAAGRLAYGGSTC